MAENKTLQFTVHAPNLIDEVMVNKGAWVYSNTQDVDEDRLNQTHVITGILGDPQ